MATIASSVQWGSSPKIYFDFSYDKKREGSTQYYNISVSCAALKGTHYFGYPIYLEIYLDGTKKTSYTLKNASPSQWSSAITYSSGWLAVSNKTSGTTALKIRIYSGSGSSRDTPYGYTLAIDPAASAISCTTANIESKPTITIARASSSYTHTVTYSFGTISGKIAEKTHATSITDWTIPAVFYSQIPNAKVGEGTLTCTTYSGSTQIGNPTTCKLYVTTDETKCKPTVSGNVIDINPHTLAITGDKDILVRFCSTAACTITTTLNNKAGAILLQTVNNTPIDGNTLEIPNVETGVFDFYAKDSREYHNADKVKKTLVPYIKLTANVTAWRVDPTSGNAVLKVEGNCFKGNFGFKDNTLTIQYQNGDAGGGKIRPTINDNNTYSVEISLSDLDYTKAFTYDVVVSDVVSTVTKQVTIQKGIPVFDWGENDFNFNVPVSINGIVVDYVVEQGTSGIWTYRKWASGIAECWGISNSVTANISVAWGSMFAKDDAIPNYPYPFSFVNMPTLSITPRRAGDSNFWTYAGYGASETQTPTVSLVRPTQMEVVAAVDYYAIGRWKG